MSRKLYLALLSTAALGTAYAPAAQAENFEFWYGNTGNVEIAIQAACDAYNASQDANEVVCVGQGGYVEAMQKAIAAYRSNENPVLIQFFDAGTLDLMLSDAVLPVSDVMPDAPWDSYINGARSYYETSTGDLFSQPYNGSTLVFYGNMTALEEAGVTELPTTWEGVYEAAVKLRDSGHACPFTTDGHPWRVLEQFSARHGVPIATKNNGYGGLDAEYIFNEGPVVQHMTNLAKWRDEGLVKLDADTEAGRYSTAFVNGECAMMEASTGSYVSAYESLGDAVQIGYAPMYEGVERRNTLIGGGSIWVMKGHSDETVAAAADFLNFLRQDSTQIELTRATGYMPVTQSALKTLLASDEADDLVFATSELGVSSLNMPGDANSRGIRLGFYMQFRDIFQEETQKAFNGDQSMQVALDNAKARGDELLRRFEQTYQGVTLP